MRNKIINNDMRDFIVDTFSTRNKLFESGRNQFYKNILFINEADKEYLQLIGKGMFDSFEDYDPSIFTEIKIESYLYKTLQKESWHVCEQWGRVWFDGHLDESKKHSLKIGTVNKNLYENREVYSQPLHEENIVLFFPILEDWLKYFKPKCENETFGTRELLKCLEYPIKHYKERKNILFNSYNWDLVEKLRPEQL